MPNLFSNDPRCDYCRGRLGVIALSDHEGHAFCSANCSNAYDAMVEQAERFEEYINGSHWNTLTPPIGKPKLGNGKYDTVEKPEHYHMYEMDTLTFLEKGFPSSVLEGFLIGNVIKYTQRYKLKNGQEDLEKVKFYSKRLAEFNMNQK